jgi:hypothetical protein
MPTGLELYIVCAIRLPGEQRADAMEKPLKEHLEYLDKRLAELTAEQMGEQTTHGQVNQIEFEIRTVRLAITHYQTALELESKIKARLQ